MQAQENIIDCYNKTAKNYSEKFVNELGHKHFDTLLLSAFASENRDRGKLIDLGCGPGQTTKWLADCGWKNILGVDLSSEMITIAKNNYPLIDFETADMLRLPWPDKTFAAAIAFYSIVHFDYSRIDSAFREIKRILSAGGQFLFSYHIGDKPVHLDEFRDHPVNIDFHFFETKKILDIITATGFEIVDIIEREHYPEEYASKRGYIWLKNNQ